MDCLILDLHWACQGHSLKPFINALASEHKPALTTLKEFFAAGMLVAYWDNLPVSDRGPLPLCTSPLPSKKEEHALKELKQAQKELGKATHAFQWLRGRNKGKQVSEASRWLFLAQVKKEALQRVVQAAKLHSMVKQAKQLAQRAETLAKWQLAKAMGLGIVFANPNVKKASAVDSLGHES